MKRLWTCALTALCCCSLITLAGEKLQEEKKPGGDKTQKEDKDGKDGKDGKKKKPRPIFGTVELKDGSAIQCEFVSPRDMSFLTPDLGLLALPFEQIRFVDLEGPIDRVSTFTPDLYSGVIETPEIQVKLLSTGKSLVLKRDGIKRMTFPDPPPPASVDPPPMPPVEPPELIDPPKIDPDK